MFFQMSIILLTGGYVTPPGIWSRQFPPGTRYTPWARYTPTPGADTHQDQVHQIIFNKYQYLICRLAHLFGISEGCFLRVTEKVLDAMINQIEDFIRWPTEGELALHAREFDRTGKFFPNVIGALDDLHIEIKLTEEMPNHRCYFCWKQFYSIHLQVVATYDMRFLDIFVGWPGRSHDARVFKNNPVYRTLPSRLRSIPLPRLAETYHILADSAFPLSPQVMTSIKKPRNRDFNHVEKKFNRHLNSKRSVSIFSIMMMYYNLHPGMVMFLHMYVCLDGGWCIFIDWTLRACSDIMFLSRFSLRSKMG